MTRTDSTLAPAVKTMLHQIYREPKRANAIVLPDMERARWFMNQLSQALGIDFSRNRNRLYLKDEEFSSMPPFSAYVLGESSHLGNRIDGLMLVDLYNCGMHFFRRNYVMLLTPGARWEAIKSKDWTMDTFDWTQEL